MVTMSPAFKVTLSELSLQLEPLPLVMVHVSDVATPFCMTVNFRSPVVLGADSVAVRLLMVPATATLSLQLSAMIADAEGSLVLVNSVGVHAPDTELYQ